MPKVFLLCSLLVLLLSCDNAVTWRFLVKNKSAVPVKISYAVREVPATMLIVLPDSALAFYKHYEFGKLVRPLTENEFEAVFKELEIISLCSMDSVIQYVPSPTDNTKWHYSTAWQEFWLKDYKVAVYTLTITDSLLESSTQ